jgi:hypothetical protein
MYKKTNAFNILLIALQGSATSYTVTDGGWVAFDPWYSFLANKSKKQYSIFIKRTGIMH